ncbi:DUF72 domain-containing protein [Pedobacter psychrodurus]|uniref:DUF72 domain-containing protein n=1 Tax=Pedobacter psychrodurus TaxID=2530456 RepID=A0A4R0PWQ4_9SPHI|nr:DUF72 domain-containing protein [Pedobacter psychrodurus]TCD26554.1 DUF72 domain-containing protein [Pedobacter psychrodurus]
MKQNIKGYYSGTSGLLLPVPNKMHYPDAFKERSRLCYYGSLMNSIEINSSFYKIPLASTVKKWSEEVPEDFRFTFKLFKGITHAPQLGFDPADIARFMEVIANAGHKKGCILVQFPPSVRIANFPQLSRLMSCLHEHDSENAWKIALEFRHTSLYVEEVMELLDENGLGIVTHDKGTAASPLDDTDSNFRYLRFHGPGGNYRGSYPEDVLAEYAGYIAEWLSAEKEVFVYFNNTMGDAIGNLKTLKRFVADIV